MDQYQTTLKDITDMFESCGCETEVTTPSPSEVRLSIKGPISMCPGAIFEEHVEQAKELMQSSYPEVVFKVDVEEAV